MKRIFFSLLAVSTMLFAACSNNDGNNKVPEHDMKKMSKDTTQHATVPNDKEVKAVVVSFTNVDTKSALSIKEIMNHYLHIKAALSNDNGGEAASGAKAMQAATSKMDKSLLTADQKKVFDSDAEELAEHAEHIANNGDKIKHQRMHFAMLSEVVYDLVKSFGAGRPVYHVHCPMYNENKGAMWLSEMKEIKNPYYGAEMLTCGSVEEVIK